MTDPADALVQDVTEMTRQAAVDGLPLASVFADLRLVLDMQPDEELPADVLRACAVAWSRAHEAMERPLDTRARTWDELEDRLWAASTAPEGGLPGWAVLVRVVDRPDPAEPVLVPAEDLLRAAAGPLAERLDPRTEHVVVLDRAGSAGPGLLVLVDGDAERAERVGAWVGGLVPGPDLVDVTRHPVGGHPEGLLAELRELAARTAPGS